MKDSQCSLYKCLPARAVILLVLMFLPWSGVYADSFKTLSFANLGKQIELKMTSDSGIYVNSSGVRFRSNGRLLIMTSLRENQIQALSKKIVRIQKLADLSRASVFWLTTTPMDMVTVMNKLNSSQGIDSVQPDLAPLVSKTSGKVKVGNLIAGSSSVPVCENTIRKPRIAIIDDGFDFSSAVFSRLRPLLEYDADAMQLNASPRISKDGHGTMVASVIFAQPENTGMKGLAPDSELIAIRQVSTWTSSVILALTVARKMGADIVNCSWTLPFLSESLKAVIDDFADSPEAPYIVVSAGNSAQPACQDNALSTLKSVLTVGALAADGERAAFSNFGDCVDVYAPSGYPVVTLNGVAAMFGGTSSAAAIVTGTIAQFLQCGARPEIQDLQALW